MHAGAGAGAEAALHSQRLAANSIRCGSAAAGSEAVRLLLIRLLICDCCPAGLQAAAIFSCHCAAAATQDASSGKAAASVCSSCWQAASPKAAAPKIPSDTARDRFMALPFDEMRLEPRQVLRDALVQALAHGAAAKAALGAYRA